ncbi:MAG: hypothetical protein KJZ86_05630 [Caldilineaceae bacterium]|nr:hypothetical protein [Caldilineaceae bacterium]HRJ44779.1 hypothetical protein [Caldilineaceae bacterium]
MTNTLQYPSYLDCVAGILGCSAEPLLVDELVNRVKAQRPTGKGVRSAVYQAIGKLYQAVPVAQATFGWLPTLLQGQTFRHPLNNSEMQRGNLLMDELEHALFFPEFFQDHQPDARLVRLHLMGGPVLEVHAAVDQETWALRMGKDFLDWVDEAGGAAYDDLLIHVLDAAAGEYSMRLQPREGRQEAEIHERNLHMARTAEAIVSGDRKSRSAMPVWELAAALIGRGVFADTVAPDDMHFVLHEHSTLRLLDDLGYAQASREYLRREKRQHEKSVGRYDGETPPWLETGQGSGRQPAGREVPDLFDDEGDGDGFWDVVEDNVTDFSDMEAAHCEGYQYYLSEFKLFMPAEDPLGHMDYHLLEAELETLVGLEHEFGYLMPEQAERKQALAARLFIDPDMFYGGDWDQSDYDAPPYWDN